MRIPNRYLEHKVTLTKIQAVGTSVGAKFDEPRTGIRALVIDKRTRVVDQRAGSDTVGTEVIASAHILLHKENWVPPSSLVTVWPGTPMERVCEVIAAGYNVHSIAPESAQLWVV